MSKRVKRPVLAPVFEGSYEEWAVRFLVERGYTAPCDIPADEYDRLVEEAVRLTPAQFYPTQEKLEELMEREMKRMFVADLLGSGALSAEEGFQVRQWAGANGVWE